VRHGDGKRCPHCVDWADSRLVRSYYDGWCATCFERLHPDGPRLKWMKPRSKEEVVINFLNAHYPETSAASFMTGQCGLLAVIVSTAAGWTIGVRSTESFWPSRQMNLDQGSFLRNFVFT
jgi:hypothetical protein